MRLGAFDVIEPIPELLEPHALAIIRPWIDVGRVGTLTLTRLESQLQAREMARFARPGSFFDFTQYRPNIYFREGRRQVTIPNVYVTYARHHPRNDFVFLHLMEPNCLAEIFVDSILRLIETCGVRRYHLIGSMYDLIPHTRPLPVSGMAVGEQAQRELDAQGVRTSDYEGPTTIAYLISQRAPDMGMDTMTSIVHLPQYTHLEEDFAGVRRLAQVLSGMYGFAWDPALESKADEQLQEIGAAVDRNPELKTVLRQLEANYDAQAKGEEVVKGETPQLSPEIEKFLREMGRRFGQN